MLTKQDQAGKYGRKAKRKRRKHCVIVSEKQLQKQLNDTLEAYGLWYIRIEDSFWSWLKQMHVSGHCPDGVFYSFCEKFAGMPDNQVFSKISGRYNLNMSIEEKTIKGKLRKDQKIWNKEIAVQLNRTTESNEKSVSEFVDQARKCRKCLEKSTS